MIRRAQNAHRYACNRIIVQYKMARKREKGSEYNGVDELIPKNS